MEPWSTPTLPVSAFTLPQLQLRPGHARLAVGPLAEPRFVRVALVGADATIRQRVVEQLAADPRTRLVASARTLQQGRLLARTDAIDVLVVELDLEDGDGLDLVQHVKREQPGTRLIVVTLFDDEEAALRAFGIGASGWLVLAGWDGNFAISVLHVADGGAALSPALARRLMRRPAQPQPSSDAGAVHATVAALSEREREVLAQVAHGLRSKEIARQLTISDETVNAHIKSIYRKLQVHSRAQLVRLASQAGIV